MENFRNIVTFKSLIDVVNYFANEKFNTQYLAYSRWGDHPVCMHCACKRVYRYSDGVRYKCSGCRKQFNAKTGTFLQGTKLPLQKWYLMMYEIVNGHGVSTYNMAKKLNITQAVAWKRMHDLRLLLCINESKNLSKLSGTVQVDETFIGGKNKNRHADKKVENSQGRSYKDKTAVLGLLQKEVSCVIERPHKLYPDVVVKEKLLLQPAFVRCVVTLNTQTKTIRPVVRKNVELNSIFVSDEWKAYRGLNKFYDHKVIDHRKKQYKTKDGFSTNGIECGWSRLKRTIIGIHYHISRKYMDNYIQEFAFRYNTRHLTTAQKFIIMLNNFATYEKEAA